MKKPCNQADSGGYGVGDLLGLGSHSVRKNYYPELQERIEELEREKNHYKWLFENALHGIFQGNLRGGFLACNPAMARICGYDSEGQLMQKVIRLREQLFCSASEFDTIRQELLDNGSLNARETCFRRVDNTPVHVAVTLLRRPDLGPEVVEAFVADISERVQARNRLERLNQELELRVIERTRALQSANEDLLFQIEERKKVERELVLAMESAREATRSKDKYLAAASHDLLQPLNAARLMVSALQDGQLPAPERRMVNQVHRALEGAEDLLADLLDISKLDQQAMEPDLVPTDLQSLAKVLGEEFDAVAANAGLDFRIRGRPAVVKTDPRMLVRIIRNLLSNAFRYTREGGILLALRPRGKGLNIEVWDTGIGIEADKLRDIFTEFHQVIPQGSGGRQGVGLGLAIVERMVRVLGYHIDVISRPGKGSRFAITLPFAEAGTLGSEPVRVDPHPGTAGLEGMCLLVIDNEPAVLESMEALLQRWGCQVVSARGLDEALGKLAGLAPEQWPSLVLADYHLDNGCTGREAIHAVRARLGRELPAAIVTADRSDEVHRLLQIDGMTILNKPVKPNRLRALITSLVSRSV